MEASKKKMAAKKKVPKSTVSIQAIKCRNKNRSHQVSHLKTRVLMPPTRRWNYAPQN